MPPRMRRTLRYFAYGSNLHPERLRRRTGWCRVLGPATLTGYRLTFHKRGMDGSGKCNALFTASGDDTLYGAVYEIHAHHKLRLDRAEGRGRGYSQARVRPVMAGGLINAFTYLAQTDYVDECLEPFDWYLDLVMEGARHHALPDHHQHALRSVSALPDPVGHRAGLHRRLVETIRRLDEAPDVRRLAPDLGGHEPTTWGTPRFRSDRRLG